MVKNDDYMSTARLSRLEAKITQLENLLYPEESDVPDESFTTMLDVQSWARFWIVNEIMDNREIRVPRSCFATFDSKNNILKAGPVWDFDWSALSMRNDCQLNRALYYDALFKSRTFRAAVKTIWAEKESLLNIPAKTRELKNLIDVAWEFDVLRWGIHKDSTRTRFESLDGNISYLQEILTTDNFAQPVALNAAN